MERRLVELRSRKDILLLKRLIAMYHAQSVPPGGGAGGGARFFVLAAAEPEHPTTWYWLAGAWLHDSTPFRFVAQRFKIPMDTSYFIRRVCKFAPGDWLVELLVLLSAQLRSEGKKALWSFGLPGHSNAVYRQAGFEEVGRTSRSDYPVFVKWLDKHPRDQKLGPLV